MFSLTRCALQLQLWFLVSWLGVTSIAPRVALGDRPALGEPIANFSVFDVCGRKQLLIPQDEAHATVLAFVGVECPISELSAPRLQELYETFAPRGVRFLAINSDERTDMEALRVFANRHALTLPVVKDYEQAVADSLGATRTAEAFVLDHELRLRYRGRIDDQYSITDRSVGVRKQQPDTPYLAAALGALLDKRPIAIAETPPLGCLIGRPSTVKQPTTLTYSRDIKPIVARHCRSCHSAGEIAPFELLDYEDVKGWSGMIREVVVARRMPPWNADPCCGEFSNDRRLSEAEIATLTEWIDGGTPQGEPAPDTEDQTRVQGWAIGKPDVVYEMPKSFSIPATGTIKYQYFEVKTNFTEDRWVTAAEVRPGNRAVVHHLLVFAIDPQRPESWRRYQGGRAGYFAAMVPGERPAMYPSGAAKRLPANAMLLFQVHYTATGKPETDRSRIGLRFATKDVRREVFTRSAYERQRLVIPASVANHTVMARHRFEEEGHLLSLLPHMHLRGEAFKYVIHYPVGHTPASEVLLSVPRYDFGWQNTYRLATPKRIPAGSVLECTAVFNNSAHHPALTRDMWEKTVRWGPQIWDEMLIGYFDLVVEKP